MTPFSNPDTALVLTAGLGTRLRPLSCVRAKPAIPLAGDTVIRRILTWLKQFGIANAVLNLHHRPETIAREVGDGSDLGIAVRYSWEPRILGSAGGPRHALPLIDRDTFLIVNGDTITNLDLRVLAEFHRQSGALATLALTRQRDYHRYGGVALDEDGAVTRFVQRGSREDAAHFIGVQIVHRAAFEDLDDEIPAECFRDAYPALFARRPKSVRGVLCAADFYDVGTPAGYLDAAIAIARIEGQEGLPSGHRSIVHPSSRLTDTILWDDVVIERGCELVRCIVADGVTVPAGSRLMNAAIVPATSCRPPQEQLAGELSIVAITANDAS